MKWNLPCSEAINKTTQLKIDIQTLLHKKLLVLFVRVADREDNF